MSTVLRSGQTIAGYRIDDVVGTGGMGVVYRATQVSLGRRVALKLLAPHLSEDPEFRERFRREAALQGNLHHPNVVTVYEAGEAEEGLFLALRYVDGTDLKRLIESGELGAARALGLLAQAAAALDAAHEAGLVHRDVKPQNILVDANDHAYLADFGLTKGADARGLTRTGTYLGSLDYVSPEQVRGEPVAAASDLYAFAAVLYEALSGEVPFPRDTEAALLYAHVHEAPPRLSERRAELPPALDEVIARGLAKEPARRYSSAAALVDDARGALERTAAALAPAAAASGRSFGETIVDSGLLRRAPVITLEEERRRPPLALSAIVAALCIGLAVAGFLLGHSLKSGARSSTSFAVAGPIVLRFPDSDWSPAAYHALPGVSLRSPVALAARRENGSLDAGFVPFVDGRTLLPGRLARRVRNPAPVRLGRVQAFRYAHVLLGKAAATVYAVPVGGGAALVVCTGSAKTRTRCESVATTLALRGARAGALGANPAYAALLRQLVSRLRTTRRSERAALARAGNAGERAVHAQVLASAYATATGQLSALFTGPRERAAQNALVTGLARARDGYVALTTALQNGDHAGYVAAAAKVARGERAADAALRTLTRLGYRIRP